MSERRLGKKIALAIGSGVLTLLVLEILSYAGGRHPGPGFPLLMRSADGIGQYDHELFWSLSPDAISDNGLLRTNSLGLRGPEPRPMDDGHFRALFLGESSTFGWDVRAEEAYPARVERLLNGDARGPQTEIINGGVPGYSVVQGYGLLLHLLPRLEIDAVLLAFGFNDFLPVAYLDQRVPKGSSSQRGLDDWTLFQQRRRPASQLAGLLAEYSNLWRTTLWLRGLMQQPENMHEAKVDMGHRRVDDHVRRHAMNLILAKCEERGIPLVIVVPLYREMVGHIEELRSFALDNDIALIDLPLLLNNEPTDHLFIDMAHPTDEGHATIARAIYAELAHLGW